MANDTLKVILDDDGDSRQPQPTGDTPTRRVDLDGSSKHAESAATVQMPLGALEPGVKILDDYVVESTLYPHETQRPGLFLCSSPQGKVIVKVYASQFPPKPDLWNRLISLRHPHVLTTIKVTEQDGRYYEVQEYCSGGTLETRVPKQGAKVSEANVEWIRQVLIPQMFEALTYLHAKEIIHRDIKPANIYVKSEDPWTLVLADFDISSVLEQTHTSRDTQRAGGTWLYTAPEAFPRFVDDRASSSRGRVTRSSDYYSLGLTIIEMLIGTTSLQQCELPDLFDFYLTGGRVEIPQGIPGDLSMLLRGLLIRNRHTRWDGSAVARWLNNQSTDDDLQRISDDEFYEFARASRPYRLNEQQAFDLPSLAEAMFREPNIATEDLITGDVLLNWIGALNPQLARDIKRDRDKLYMTPPLVLNQSIMRCDQTRPFIFADGSEAQSTNQWITRALSLLRSQGTTAESFCTPELLYQLEAWLRYKLQPETDKADAVAKIQKSPPRVQLEELAYLFQPDRPYLITRGVIARTPQELAQLSYGSPTDWGTTKRPANYDASYQRWFDGSLSAWLRQRGLAELARKCDVIREQLGEETFAAFETVLRLLDPDLPKVKVTLDLSAVAHQRIISYGRQVTYSLPYRAHGSGVPFGTLFVSENATGIEVMDHLIRQRKGKIELRIDTRQGQQIAKSYQVKLEIDGGIAELADTTNQFSYRVDYSKDALRARLLAGAGIGATIFGIPRIISALLGKWQTVNLGDINLFEGWDATMAKQFPLFSLFISCIIFLVLLYFGVRMWIRAIRGSEV